MKLFSKNITWHDIFGLTIYVKAFNGLWELTVGLFGLLASKAMLTRLFVSLSAEEVAEDSKDALVNFFNHALQNLSVSAQTFVAVYLLIHGLINLGLAWGLWRKKLLAYLLAITFTTLFLIYQIYRLCGHFSWSLFIITIFDIFFIWLTWRESRRFHPSS